MRKPRHVEMAAGYQQTLRRDEIEDAPTTLGS
jgi:hypothetical protein